MALSQDERDVMNGETMASYRRKYDAARKEIEYLQSQIQSKQNAMQMARDLALNECELIAKNIYSSTDAIEAREIYDLIRGLRSREVDSEPVG